VKLLIVGGDSLTGQALQTLLAGASAQIPPGARTEARVSYKVLDTGTIDLLQKMDVAKAVSQFAPTLVINVASYSNLELSERDVNAARLCDEQNSLVPAVLAEVCAHLNLPLIQHSSSFVFDGLKLHPYIEDDAANPVCRYGRSKWYGERAIRAALPNHFILRTDWVFSPQHPAFFQRHIAQCKEQLGKLDVLNHRFSPTPAADVARVLLAVARQIDCAADVWGTYHYVAQQPLSQEAFVEQVLHEAATYDQALAAMLPHLQFTKRPVQLPYIANSVLNGQKLFETFGIKARPRNTAVTALIKQLYGMSPAQPPEPTEKRSGFDDAADESATTRQTLMRSTNGRRPSRKVATRKD